MPVEVGCFQNPAIGIDHTRSSHPDSEHGCGCFGDQIPDQFHRRLVGSLAHRVLGNSGRVDLLVDPSAQVNECCPEGSMAQVDGNDVPPTLVEGKQRRGLATRRGSLAKLPQQSGFDEFPDQAGDRGAGESGLTGDLGSTGCTSVRNQFQGGSQIAAARVVFGGLGVSHQGRMRIALVQIASHHISSPAVVSRVGQR